MAENTDSLKIPKKSKAAVNLNSKDRKVSFNVEKKHTTDDILKPVLGQLKEEMRTLDTEAANFTYLPMCFQDPPPIEEEYRVFKFLSTNNKQKNSKKGNKLSCSLRISAPVMRSDQPWNQKYLKHFIRNYDICRIREERMLQSFSIGRKIIPKENSDLRLNNEIQNTVMGLCMRKPK